MAQDLKRGQFWRDQVNGDLLRIESFSLYYSERPANAVAEAIAEPTQYVKCTCYVHGFWFGIQEMRTLHFQNVDRFKRLSWFGGYWVLVRARLRALRNR